MNFAGLEYLQIMLAPLAPILLVVGAIVAVWLILRPIRMWYWKVDRQKAELENVNRQLTEIRTALEEKDTTKAAAEAQITDQQSSDVQGADAKILEILTGDVVDVQEPEKADIAEENFAEPQKRRKLGICDYATDRKGRTYTQEEIEAQIRD